MIFLFFLNQDLFVFMEVSIIAQIMSESQALTKLSSKYINSGYF